jgi:GAF domain-containing protein
VVIDVVPADPDQDADESDLVTIDAAPSRQQIPGLVGAAPPPPGPPVLKYVASSMPSTLTSGLQDRLVRYRERSREYHFAPRTGVPGRVFLTKRPEWLPWLTDPVAFPRSPHAQRYDVKLTFAVPVVVEGVVRMVVEFYDTEARDYDPEVLNVAGDIASLIGRAYYARHEGDLDPKVATPSSSVAS